MSGSDSVDSVHSSAVDDTAPHDSGAVVHTRPMSDTSLNETTANDPVLNAEGEMMRRNDNTKPVFSSAKQLVEAATGKLQYYRRIQCPVCHQHMRRSDLPKHMRGEHGASKVIRCSVCRAVFADDLAEWKHMKQNHFQAAVARRLRYMKPTENIPHKKRKAEPAQCPVCMTVLSRNMCDHLLSRHGIVHISMCDHCNDVFFKEEDLKEHMNLRHSHIQDATSSNEQDTAVVKIEENFSYPSSASTSTSVSPTGKRKFSSVPVSRKENMVQVQDTKSSCGQDTIVVKVEDEDSSPPRNMPKSTGVRRNKKRERSVKRNIEESWKSRRCRFFKRNPSKCEICHDGYEDIDGHLRQFHPYAVRINGSDTPYGESGQGKYGVCRTVGFECTICSETMPTAADFSVHMDVVHAKDFTLASDDDANRWPYCIAIKTIVD